MGCSNSKNQDFDSTVTEKGSTVNLSIAGSPQKYHSSMKDKGKNEDNIKYPPEITHPIAQIVYQITPDSFIFNHGTYGVKHYGIEKFRKIKTTFESFKFVSTLKKSQVAQCLLAMFQKCDTLTVWGYWLTNIEETGAPPVDIDVVKESACHCLIRTLSTDIQCMIWERLIDHPAYHPYLNSKEYTFGSRTMMQAIIRFYKELSPKMIKLWSVYPEFKEHLQHRKLLDVANNDTVKKETQHIIFKKGSRKKETVTEHIPQWKLLAVILHDEANDKKIQDIPEWWKQQDKRFGNYVIKSLVCQYLIQRYVLEWKADSPKFIKFFLSEMQDLDREPFDWYQKQGTLQSLLASAIKFKDKCETLVNLFSHPTYARVILYHQTDPREKSVVQRIATVWHKFDHIKEDFHFDLCRILYHYSPVEYHTYLNNIIPSIEFNLSHPPK